MRRHPSPSRLLHHYTWMRREVDLAHRAHAHRGIGCRHGMDGVGRRTAKRHGAAAFRGGRPVKTFNATATRASCVGRGNGT